MKRWFLPVVLAATMPAVWLLSPAVAAAQTFSDGVASGDATSTSAILWTRIDGGGQAKVEVWDNAGLKGKKAFQRTVTHVSSATDFTIKIDATGLSPNTTYYYRFKHGVEGTGETELSPVGSFKTAPAADTPSNLKFTYSGDADGIKCSAITGNPPVCTQDPNGTPFYNNWEVLNQAKLEGGDFFAYLGDTIYSDSEAGVPPVTTLPEYRAKYRQNRTYSNLTNLLASTSTYAQWDDHEVVNDFQGQTVNPARYAAGRQAFLEYNPIRTSGLLHDPTCAGDPLYRHFKWGSDVEIFIPDERSCRSAEVVAQCNGDLGPTLPPAIRTQFPFSAFLTPNPPAGCLSALFDPSRTMLGPVQKQALKNDLASSTAKWKLIINEVPIQQLFAAPYDRWEGYGAERNELLDFMRDDVDGNAVFLTTDTHANLVNQVFKDRFENCTTVSTSCTPAPTTVSNEVVAGPIATKTFQREVVEQFGFTGLFALSSALNVAGVDCKNLNQNSYGVVNVNQAGGTAQVDLKDPTGAPVQNSGPFFNCTATYGP
jgi:phosphodiesterase/alkaline phosphatase D-like protein